MLAAKELSAKLRTAKENVPGRMLSEVAFFATMSDPRHGWGDVDEFHLKLSPLFD